MIIDAITVYKMMQSRLPSKLESLIPDYIPNQKYYYDFWDRVILYYYDEMLENYYLVSLGSDDQFKGLNQRGIYYDLSGHDIIFIGNKLVFGPLLE